MAEFFHPCQSQYLNYLYFILLDSPTTRSSMNTHSHECEVLLEINRTHTGPTMQFQLEIESLYIKSQEESRMQSSGTEILPNTNIILIIIFRLL